MSRKPSLHATKLPVSKKSSHQSYLLDVKDEAMEAYDFFKNPIKTEKFSLEGGFKPKVDFDWDPSGDFTKWGSPKITPTFGGNITATYKPSDRFTFSGGTNFGTNVKTSSLNPSKMPYWAGLTFNLQNGTTPKAQNIGDIFGGDKGTIEPYNPEDWDTDTKMIEDIEKDVSYFQNKNDDQWWNENIYNFLDII